MKLAMDSEHTTIALRKRVAQLKLVVLLARRHVMPTHNTSYVRIYD